MSQRARELAAAFGLLTRLPVWRLVPLPPDDAARGVWAYPLVGAAIGALSALVYALAVRLGFAPALAAAWTLAASLALTGALHEDGLADAADGFGGGHTPQRTLEIMRDSRIGSYGALALIMAVAVRLAAVSSLADPGRVAVALVVAGTLARGAIVLVLATTQPARPDGMAARLGQVPAAASAAALGITLIAAVLLLPGGRAAGLLLVAAAIALGLRHWAVLRIGGHTGDTLGATAAAVDCVALSLLTL